MGTKLTNLICLKCVCSAPSPPSKLSKFYSMFLRRQLEASRRIAADLANQRAARERREHSQDEQEQANVAAATTTTGDKPVSRVRIAATPTITTTTAASATSGFLGASKAMAIRAVSPDNAQGHMRVFVPAPATITLSSPQHAGFASTALPTAAAGPHPSAPRHATAVAATAAGSSTLKVAAHAALATTTTAFAARTTTATTADFAATPSASRGGSYVVRHTFDQVFAWTVHRQTHTPMFVRARTPRRVRRMYATQVCSFLSLVDDELYSWDLQDWAKGWTGEEPPATPPTDGGATPPLAATIEAPEEGEPHAGGLRSVLEMGVMHNPAYHLRSGHTERHSTGTGSHNDSSSSTSLLTQRAPQSKARKVTVRTVEPPRSKSLRTRAELRRQARQYAQATKSPVPRPGGAGGDEAGTAPETNGSEAATTSDDHPTGSQEQSTGSATAPRHRFKRAARKLMITATGARQALAMDAAARARRAPQVVRLVSTNDGVSGVALTWDACFLVRCAHLSCRLQLCCCTELRTGVAHHPCLACLWPLTCVCVHVL